MKNDIDNLMKEANLDALLISGSAGHNPAMTYFTGMVHVSGAYLLKKRDESPILFHNPMEREEAALTGFTTKSLDDYDVAEFVQLADGSSHR